MTFTPEQIKSLEAKLDAKHVKPPPQGKHGSYVEGWHVIAEANRIFGFDGWSYKVDQLTCTNSGPRGDKFACGYMALVTVSAGDAIRQDVGHGQGFSKSEGDAHDSAIKEAVTDALKRALRTFGNPFGLALYDKTQENVERSPKPNGVTPPATPEEAEQRLVRGIKDRATPIALNKFVTQSSFVEAFEDLPAQARARVQGVIDVRRAELNNTLGAG